MIDSGSTGGDGCGRPEGLSLSVGCEFGLDSVQRATAIVQVAPRLGRGVSINAERWDTNAVHHSYLDQYGNRCERFELTPGVSQITYEAQLTVPQPADVIEPDAPEVPVQLLPDEVLNFVMPSRFCLPDELGQEAWQRFGDVAPGWARVQTIVDYVHGHLEFVPGASNPWTTAADAYRAGRGVQALLDGPRIPSTAHAGVARDRPRCALPGRRHRRTRRGRRDRDHERRGLRGPGLRAGRFGLAGHRRPPRDRAMNHLLRRHAPITDSGWRLIDDEALARCTPALAARRGGCLSGPARRGRRGPQPC